MCDAFSVLACRQGQGGGAAGAGQACAAVQSPRRCAPSLAIWICSAGHALLRKRSWIIVPTVMALVLSLAAVNMVTPRYKSEARILIDGRENVFLRPNGDRNEERTRSIRKR